MTVTINGSSGITAPEVILDNTTADGGQVVLKSSGYSNWNLDNYSGRIRAYYGSTEYFTINSSGNVGIGTSSPSAKLNLTSTGNTTADGVRLTLGSEARSHNIYSALSTGRDLTIAPYRALTINTGSGTTEGVLALNAYEYTTFGTGSSYTERARIDSSGNLLVGKTATSTTTFGAEIRAADAAFYSTCTASTNTTSTYNVYSTGASAYRFYVGLAGNIYATSTSITGISDQRLKENIRDLDDGLDKVMALKPRKFDWKEGKGADIKDARGFIAQEFETVFPDLIDEWKDPAPEGEEPYKSVRADLIPTLVKAIQEQQAIIESLKTRIETLENK